MNIDAIHIAIYSDVLWHSQEEWDAEPPVSLAVTPYKRTRMCTEIRDSKCLGWRSSKAVISGNPGVLGAEGCPLGSDEAVGMRRI